MEPLGAGDPRVVGGFRLRARLGAGGMGRVYLATSTAGRAVAVKVVHAELAANGEFIRRFAAEVAAAKAVSGLYTAPVVAAGTDDDPPWLATAYVPGPSLGELVALDGPLPLAALWRLAAGVAEALEAIHDCGLVHRDLKPTNVLIAADGPRVIDFGIARALDSTALTGTGMVIGTVGYMPPEQVTGGSTGPAGDVFSLGCVLAFAAAGSNPFAPPSGAAPGAVLYRVAHGTPDLEGVPDPLRGLVAHCLSRDPAGRPTPGEVAARAAALGEDPEPGAFWPPGFTAAIDGWQARHPLPPPPTPATAPAPEPATPAASVIPGVPATQPPGGAANRPDAQQRELAKTNEIAGQSWLNRRRLLAGIGGLSAAAICAYAGVRLAADGNSPGTVVWSGATDQPVTSDLTVTGGVLYCRDRSNKVYAIDAVHGRRLWTFPAGGSEDNAAPLVADGLVYVCGQDGLSALSATTGEKVWQHGSADEGPYNDMAECAVSDGRIFFSAGEPGSSYGIYAVDAATGSGAQQFAPGVAPGALSLPLAVADGTLYAAAGGTLCAIRVSDGTLLWDATGLQSIDTTPVVSAAFVYVLVSDGTGIGAAKVVALDRATGRVRWTYPLDRNPLGYLNPVVANGHVYATDSDKLHAIDAVTGSQAWTFNDAVGPGLATADGVVYVSDGSLYALDAKTGATIFTTQAPTTPELDPFSSSVAVSGALVYAPTMDNKVLAIRAAR